MGQMMLLFSVHPFSCLFKTQERLCALTHTLPLETLLCVLGKAGQIFFLTFGKHQFFFSKNLKPAVLCFANPDMLPFYTKLQISSSLSLAITGLVASLNVLQAPLLIKKWQMAVQHQQTLRETQHRVREEGERNLNVVRDDDMY